MNRTASVCAKCGEPIRAVIFFIDGVGAVCDRKHKGDPPDWEPISLSLSERLAFFKEAKEFLKYD